MQSTSGMAEALGCGLRWHPWSFLQGWHKTQVGTARPWAVALPAGRGGKGALATSDLSWSFLL